MLNENQLKLLRHLARFNLLDYPSCLDMLNNDGGSDRTALSYAFRPLTKNRYVSKDKRGCVSILAKGRALFPELEPLEVPVPMETVQDNLKTKEYLEVDARPALRFQGIGETIDHKAGHIPGAVNRPGSENFLPDGRFKPAPVLREEFLKLLDGRAPDKVINSCGSGVNASANLFAMDLSGLYGSKLYVGSWSQWIDDDANPVATGK